MKPLSDRIRALTTAARHWQEARHEAQDLDPDLVDQVHAAVAELAREARLVVKAAGRHVAASDLEVPPTAGDPGLAGAARDLAAALEALEPEWGGVPLEDSEYRAQPEALAEAARRLAEVLGDEPEDSDLEALLDELDPAVYNPW